MAIPPLLFRDISSIAQYSVLSRESNALNLLDQSSLRRICGNASFFTVRRGADQIEAAEHGAWKPPDRRKRLSGLRPLCRARPETQAKMEDPARAKWRACCWLSEYSAFYRDSTRRPDHKPWSRNRRG